MTSAMLQGEPFRIITRISGEDCCRWRHTGLTPASEGLDDGHVPAAARTWRAVISGLVGFGLLDRRGEPSSLQTSAMASLCVELASRP